MNMEKFVLGFGVFGIIISITATGCCLAGYLYMVWCAAFHKAHYGYELYYILAAIMTVLLHFAVISLVASILLVKGVKQKNPRLLRMYFIFGCLLNVASAVGVTIYVVCLQEGSLLVGIVLPCCSIYSVVLAVVLKTQLKFQLMLNREKHPIHNNQYVFLEQSLVV